MDKIITELDVLDLNVDESISNNCHEGKVDKKITELVDHISNIKDLEVISSCSGKILVATMEGDDDSGEDARGHGDLIHVNHNPVKEVDNFVQLIKEANSAHKDLLFLCKPFTLHLTCRNKETAETLISLAMTCGFKESGLIYGPNEHEVIVAIRNETLDNYVTYNGDEEFWPIMKDILKSNVVFCNNRLEENDFFTQVFEEGVLQRFPPAVVSDVPSN